ncbi:hypothetical protein MXB_3017 [Myxobolus squamalis]|nr:hypothetical protein MXB_3017 [Myxobolus squamalis]
MHESNNHCLPHNNEIEGLSITLCAESIVLHHRTKPHIYSGRRKSSHILSLTDLCINTIISNIDRIFIFDSKGNYDFSRIEHDLMMKILKRCNPKQIKIIEIKNTNLKKETEEIWETHCKALTEISSIPPNCSSWREAYDKINDRSTRDLSKIASKIVQKKKNAPKPRAMKCMPSCKITTRNRPISQGTIVHPPQKNTKIYYLAEMPIGLKKTLEMMHHEQYLYY